MSVDPNFSGQIAEEWTGRQHTARPLAIGAAAALLALLPLLWIRGFTVDDALITARVAAHLHAGLGYRFNATGPPVDAVTPLGWAYALSPFAGGGPLAALSAARWMGALCWLAAAGWLGAEVARLRGSPLRFSPLLVLAVCAPLAAWSVAGMETGVVVGLATLALVRSPWAVLPAGLAAAWRPELLPWALVLVVGTGLAARRSIQRVLGLAALVLLPALIVAVTRELAFGHPAPLAVFAKPSDLSHGLRYAWGALAFTGPPLLLLAPWSLRRIGGHERAIAAACAVHVVSLLLAGGDWMALYRLMVPVLPGLLLVGAAIAGVARPWATALRLVAALGVSLVVLFAIGRVARRVGPNRMALIEAAAAPLAGGRHVASLDVGWVGAATRAEVEDLSGVTDPRVAVLPGGHTTKRIPDGWLEARQVDRLVLLLAPGEKPALPWWHSRFDRGVEQRVARQAGDRYAVLTRIPLGGTRQSYLILQLKK